MGRPPAQAETGCRADADVLGSRIVHRPVDTYSGGQRRRLEIARALISRPRSSSWTSRPSASTHGSATSCSTLSPGLRDRIDLTILLTTHYLEEAERLCDRVAIMHHGPVVALASPRSLLAGLGEEILEFRVHDDAPRDSAHLQDRGIAGEDAFAIGAR